MNASWNPPELKPSPATGFVFVRWEDEDKKARTQLGYWNGRGFCQVLPVNDKNSVYWDTFDEIGTVTGWMPVTYPPVEHGS